MPYNLLSKIAPQYSNSGFVNNINLSKFQGDSVQTPGFGRIAASSTFYLPLRGSLSAYEQTKLVTDVQTKPTPMEIEVLPETIKPQTGFGQTDKVLELLYQGQKHKLEDNVYGAMTSPIIKIKKVKFNPVITKVEPAIVKSENFAKSGKGSSKTLKKSAHKFNVI